MCGSMVDIQSVTAEIRRGKNRRKIPQDENIMSVSATQGGHYERPTHYWGQGSRVQSAESDSPLLGLYICPSFGC